MPLPICKDRVITLEPTISCQSMGKKYERIDKLRVGVFVLAIGQRASVCARARADKVGTCEMVVAQSQCVTRKLLSKQMSRTTTTVIKTAKTTATATTTTATATTSQTQVNKYIVKIGSQHNANITCIKHNVHTRIVRCVPLFVDTTCDSMAVIQRSPTERATASDRWCNEASNSDFLRNLSDAFIVRSCATCVPYIRYSSRYVIRVQITIIIIIDIFTAGRSYLHLIVVAGCVFIAVCAAVHYLKFISMASYSPKQARTHFRVGYERGCSVDGGRGRWRGSSGI